MSTSVTMMDLSHSCPGPGEDRTTTSPKGLTVKLPSKRSKPIPPPLNLQHDLHTESAPLSAVTCLKEFAIIATGPQSPLIQKNLPFRKRAHSIPDGEECGPYSAPAIFSNALSSFPFKQDNCLDEDSNPPLNLCLPVTSKACQDQRGAGAVVPSTHPEVASPLVSSTADGPYVGFGQHRHPIPSWSPFLPPVPTHWLGGVGVGAPSALLSPAPSSLGGSQEDLRHASAAGILYESDRWRLPWPFPVWHCFQIGTILQFSFDNTEVTLCAEEVQKSVELQFLTPERFGPLCIQRIIPSENSKGMVEITFSCVAPGLASDVRIVATSQLHHTFLVIDKGWCAVRPELVLHTYGIPCQPLECGDTCALPPKVPPASSPGICEKLKRFSFSPDELGASGPQVSSSLMLSPPNTPTMNSQQLLQPQPQESSPSSPAKGSRSKKKSGTPPKRARAPKKSANQPTDPDRPKRPMNAFMLFAKEYRLKLIRLHPGKDNRFVSVILGEAWRELPLEQKEVFIARSQVLAEERKRLHPECWKRKATQSSNGQGDKALASSLK